MWRDARDVWAGVSNDFEHLFSVRSRKVKSQMARILPPVRLIVRIGRASVGFRASPGLNSWQIRDCVKHRYSRFKSILIEKIVERDKHSRLVAIAYCGAIRRVCWVWKTNLPALLHADEN